MSKKATDKEVEAVLERLANGEDLPSGWAFDAGQDPPVFKVEETEPAKEPDATD